jgi:hypothetical protein
MGLDLVFSRKRCPGKASPITSLQQARIGFLARPWPAALPFAQKAPFLLQAQVSSCRLSSRLLRDMPQSKGFCYFFHLTDLTA